MQQLVSWPSAGSWKAVATQAASKPKQADARRSAPGAARCAVPCAHTWSHLGVAGQHKGHGEEGKVLGEQALHLLQVARHGPLSADLQHAVEVVDLLHSHGCAPGGQSSGQVNVQYRR